jgi:anti-sigma regulatory factor (Ser/Thr protein kinase)
MEAAAMALDQAFDAGTLRELRTAVLAEAAAAGMPDDRATRVMLAVHELAANAVCHGGGTGRVRMRVTAGELCCEVTDAGPGSINGDARWGGTDAASPWPFQRGHGLWLVQNAADHVSVTSGPGGSQMTVLFALPEFRGAH